MSENDKTHDRCANDACGRPVEAGEKFCAECGLEQSLFFRERRDDPPGAAAEFRSSEPRR